MADHPSRPLHLSDAEMTAVLDAARPIPVAMRDAFLRSVAFALRTRGGEIGPGTVHQVCRELQRQFVDYPLDTGERHEPKHHRTRVGEAIGRSDAI